MPRRILGGFPVQVDEYVNVERLGAKGDGTSDDTTQFQAAIDLLPAAGGIIQVPEGNFIATAGSLSVGAKTVFWILNGQVNTSYTPAGWPGTIINSGLSALAASSVTIVDTGTYFTGTDVEAALQEIGASLAAGAAGIANIVEDVTPQLGAALDVNGFAITSAAAADVTISPDTTGNIVLDADDVFVEEDIIHTGDVDNKIVFGTDTQSYETGGTSRLDISDTGVRLGAAGARVTTVLDEDAMGTDSATALATQQSIKAYVDAQVAAVSATTLGHWREQQTAGTAGGTFTAGARRTRALATEVTNTISGASLAANQITLPAGTFDIDAHAVAFRVAGHVAVLANITDVADTVIGSAEDSRTGTDTVPTRSLIKGRFTIAGAKVFEIQHICDTTRATDGLGLAVGQSVVEIYTDVLIRKIA